MWEKSGYLLSGDRFLCGAENYPLHKAMVDHDQQRVKARGSGEIGDEVVRDLLEGAKGVGFDQDEREGGEVCVRLVLLACGTALNVLAYELRKTQPPELSSDELAGFEVARVTSSLVVMTVGKDGAMERVVQGDIDTSLVGEDVVVKPPI